MGGRGEKGQTRQEEAAREVESQGADVKKMERRSQMDAVTKNCKYLKARAEQMEECAAS